MKSSGIIKRGLATTAISALAVAGIPALAGTAHAAVGSVTVTAFDAYDIDEFTQGDTDDIVVNVKETNGQPTVGQDVEFSYVYTPEGGPAQAATAFAPGGTTDANGQVDLTFVPPASGTYVVTVRTVGSQIAAAPFTIQVGEAELVWADGASASSPVNGTDTYTAKLQLTNAGRSPLVQRDIVATFAPGGDAAFGPQVVPSVRVNATNATSRTGADGSFTLSLTDPAANPGGVAETGTLSAVSPDAQGPGDTANADAAADLEVNFEPTPVVKKVEVATKNVFGGAPAPGKPVELNVTVTGEGPTNADNDDVILKDYPVTFSVDKGFLTPDNAPTGMNVTAGDLSLIADQDDEGDLFGFYENLGASTTADTSDDAANADDNAAGMVATIEKDADFNDDGRATQTVTVTAGGKTASTTINYDSSNYLNLPAAAFLRDSGVSRPGNRVELKLFAADQYGNLVGGESADVVDNTPVARVDAEAGGVTTDFINDNPSVTATSTGEVQQVITATIDAHKTLVAANGDPVQSNSTTTAEYTVNWTNRVAKQNINAKLGGNNKSARQDRIRVNTGPGARAAGATATLYKVVKGKKRQIGKKPLNQRGKATWIKRDTNGNRVTRYFVHVAPTATTKGKRTNTLRLK